VVQGMKHRVCTVMPRRHGINMYATKHWLGSFKMEKREDEARKQSAAAT
jgi:hypothetical protein